MGLSDKVNRYFEEMCSISRSSGNEEKISDYIIAFAKTHRLAYDRDNLWNVVVKKDATGSFIRKDAAPVIMQAHMDMVCVPAAPEYDWRQGVHPVIDGNKMRGQDPKTGNYTSLGADDGIGVASILAILDSSEIEHPPIIAVFTSQEESGMGGARGITREFIQKTAGSLRLDTARFINVDEEQDGRFCASCAGGIRVKMSIKADVVGKPKNTLFYSVSVSGLTGGHSGICMGLGRANAHRLMGRLLNQLILKGIPVNLYDISGGDAENAIPTSCRAGIMIPERQKEAFEKELKAIHDMFYSEYNHGRAPGNGVEKDLIVSFDAVDPAAVRQVFSGRCLQQIVNAIMIIPNDVVAMDINVQGLVETSSNLGLLEYKDGMVSLTCAVRSSVESRKRMVVNQMQLVSESLGCAVFEERDDYPGWTYKAGSELQEVFLSTYAELFKEPKPTAIAVHAGLECGFFAEKLGDIDMIACGPTINDVHSVNETLYLDTVPKTVELLAAVLKKL